MNGQWVTLHIQHLGGGEDRTLLGYLVPDGTTPGYKLTKLAVNLHQPEGLETVIHEGTWIVAPHFVWMVEYEDEAPVAGYFTEGY